MSVGLFKYNKDISNKNHQLILTLMVASERYYEKYWRKIVQECDIQLFKEDGEFYDSDKEQVMSELLRINDWVNKNVTDPEDRIYMMGRMEYLLKRMPKAFEAEHGKFYIF